MNILVTGANGQLGMCLRDRAKGDFIFTDVVEVPGVATTHLDITNLDAIRQWYYVCCSIIILYILC